MEISPAYLSKKEAAEFLRVSPWTISAWLTQKRLLRVKAGSRTLLLRSDLERFLRAGTEEAGR